MPDRQPGAAPVAPESESVAASDSRQVDSTLIRVLKWALVLGSALFILLLPVPAGITPQSWRLLAIFVATIVGGIVRPIPSGAVVLLGVTAIMLTALCRRLTHCAATPTRLSGWCSRPFSFRAA